MWIQYQVHQKKNLSLDLQGKFRTSVKTLNPTSNVWNRFSRGRFNRVLGFQGFRVSEVFESFSLRTSLQKPCFEGFVRLELVVNLVGLDGNNASQSTQAPFQVQMCTTGSASSRRPTGNIWKLSSRGRFSRALGFQRVLRAFPCILRWRNHVLKGSQDWKWW